MLTQVMQDAINEQINNELFSSYSYLSMAAWCQHEQFTGCAHWMRLQSEEEKIHAHKLYDFLLARNAKVVLKPIAQPESEFASVAQVFEKALRKSNESPRRSTNSTNWPSRKKPLLRSWNLNGSSPSKWKKKRRPAKWCTNSILSRTIPHRSWISTANSPSGNPNPRAVEASAIKLCRRSYPLVRSACRYGRLAACDCRSAPARRSSRRPTAQRSVSRH